MQVVVTHDDASGLQTSGAELKLRVDLNVQTQLRFDTSHPSNAGNTIVFSHNNTLTPPLSASHTIGGSSLVLHSSTGVPGLAGSGMTLFSWAASAVCDEQNHLYFGYPGSTALQISLSGDVQGSCVGMGSIKTHRIKTGSSLEGYPPTNDAGERVLHIRHGSYMGDKTNCIIQIGQEGDGQCRLYNVNAHDKLGTRRLNVNTAGIQTSGDVAAVLESDEKFTCSDSSGIEVYAVDAAGNVAATSFTCLSDSRMKCNIVALGDGLQTIQRLSCYKYNFCIGDAALHFGLLSHEVEKILPDVVTTGANGAPDRINYSELIPILILAMQELAVVVSIIRTVLVLLCFVFSLCALWHLTSAGW